MYAMLFRSMLGIKMVLIARKDEFEVSVPAAATCPLKQRLAPETFIRYNT